MNKYGNLEAIIWDMDGVLIDSRQTHLQAFQVILGKYGWKFDDEFLLKTFGTPNEESINLITGNTLDKEEVENLSVEKDKYFCELIVEQAEYLPGVEEWLNQFKNDGIPQALASSGSRENINTILDALDARQFIDAIVSGEDKVGKPDPYVFLQAARELDVTPHNCLVIEDSQPGLQAAEAAEMKILAVTTTNPPEKLKKADLVLTDLTLLKSNAIHSLFSKTR